MEGMVVFMSEPARILPIVWGTLECLIFNAFLYSVVSE
jgi:hypothetical protein